MVKRILYLAIFLICQRAQSQVTIIGPSSAEYGSEVIYSFSISGGGVSGVPTWTITGGGAIIIACNTPRNVTTLTEACPTIRVRTTTTSNQIQVSVSFPSGQSASRTTTIIQPIRVNSIPERMDVAFNSSPGELPEVSATGGSGVITYRYQRSADLLSWTDVGGATTSHTGLNYNPGNLTVGTYFRIRATAGSRSSFSNTLFVNVIPAGDGGIITYAQRIAANTRPVVLKGTAPRGLQVNQVNGSVSYQWEQSSDGTNWSFAGGTQKDFWPPVLTASTHYRRRVLVNGTTRAFSNQLLITVVPNVAALTPSANVVTGINQAPVLLADLSGRTATQFNRVIQFSAKRPGLTLPANLLDIANQDGNVEITYSDGVQRPVQQISQRETPAGHDIVQASQYDEFGRANIQFLPFTDGQGNAGLFRDLAGTSQRSFYQSRFPGDQFPYARTVTESTVEGEPIAQSAPGAAYSGTMIASRADQRFYSESEEVIYFSLNNADQVIANGSLSARFYGNRDLVVDEVYDVNGRRLFRYTDLKGRLVMEKIQNVETPPTHHTNGWNISYFVYDELNQLRFIIPSNATKTLLQELSSFSAGTYIANSTVLSQLCYEFRYDVQGRVIYKKIPELAPELFVFDQAGRQVLSQDPKQRIIGQWSFIKFDTKDRPVMTGVWNAGTGISEATIRAQAAVSSDYPVLNGSTEIHSETFYDGYSFPGASTRNFNAGLFSQVPTGSNQVDPTPSLMLNDLVTGTRIKVFYPAGVTGPEWLTTVNHYDNRARLIQVHTDNILGGTDVLSTRYSFDGLILGQYYRHHNPKPQAQYAQLDIVKRNVYDVEGRLLQVFQRVNQEPERQLLAFEYNELNQLSRKILGPGAGSQGSHLEQLNYTYNIQGQITGINANYARDRTAGHWWGTSVHYYDGFTQPRFDGTVSGVVWRSRGRFDEASAYGYDYDAMSRLKQAYFSQSTAVNITGSSWDQQKNFSTDQLSYDENGNIGTMRSQSTVFGSTRTIDQLSYQYGSNSNRLTRVTDAGSGTAAGAAVPGIAGAQGLKDFKDGANGGDDYTYDANGNVVGDLNKSFTATYNVLDKPDRYVFEGNQQKDIRYVYNAAGDRLQKISRHNDTVITISYVDGLTIMNDTALLFFVNDAGRTRRNYRGRLVNDYFIEDHLGNTRMVLTDERDTAAYAASFEETRNTIELATWRNRNQTREVVPNHLPLFNNPNPNQQASRLNGADPNRRKGPGLVLRVMAGDTLNISTRALYTAGSVPGGSPAVNDMLNAIVSGFLGAATGNALLDGKAWLPTAGGLVVNTNAMGDFITQTQNNNSNNNTPRAYLKYILMDENFNTVQSHAERIDDGAGAVHTYTTGGQLVIPKNGFLYVFTTNESPVDVWFDDVTVVHRTGPLLQESSFYPFGMEIVPLSSYAAIKTPNERDYQRNELDEEFGLELHYFDARMYDGQVGRFQGMDVYADKFSGLTPYNYAGNNPMYFVDADGREIVTALVAKFLVKIFAKKLAKKIAIKKAGNAGKMATLKAKLAGQPTNMWTPFSDFVSTYKKIDKGLNLAQTIGSWVGGGSNVVRNWDNITKGGGFDVFRAVSYFYTGSASGQLAALTTPIATLAGVGLGGILNVGVDLEQNDGTLDREGGFWKSFSRGALSALTAKSISKSFLKGMNVKVDPEWTQKWFIQGGLGGVEKGVQTVFSSYNKYGPGAAKKFGRGFYGQQFAAGFAGGFLKGAAGQTLTKLQADLDESNPDIYNLSLFNVGGVSVGADYTKKIVAKSLNKEYKKYLSKNSSFDESPLLNFFFQMFSYSAGTGFK